MVFLNSLFGDGMLAMYGEAILVTLKVTLLSTLLAYVFGIPLGVLLYGTSKDSIFESGTVNGIVGTIVNIIR
jgi:D-methionine transport system permease protein